MGFLRSGQARLLALVALAAAGLAAALIAISVSGSGGGSAPPSTTLYGVATTRAMLDGIPQRGRELGAAKAPVTLVEYADIQCPYCAQWARETLPTIVEEYVRPGKVKLVFVGMAFLGPDSETALRAALAAGAQNRLWHVLDLLFYNQGEESSGWVTEDLLRRIGEAVPGLDTERMLAEADSDAVTAALARDAQRAAEAGIRGTPSFEVGRSGGKLERLTVSSLEPDAFRPALDELLAR